MATSKHPKTKKPKRKSKARQTILSDFPVLQEPPATRSGPSSSSVHQSTRAVVDAPDNLSVPSLATVSARKKPSNVGENKSRNRNRNKPKQQKLQLLNPHAVPVLTSTQPSPPPSPPSKLPSFAIIIYTSPKKNSPQQNSQVGSWFQPGIPVDLGQDVISPPSQPPRDKIKEKDRVSQDTESIDEDDGPILASARKRKGKSASAVFGKAAEDNKGYHDGNDYNDDNDDDDNDVDVAASSMSPSKGLGKRVKVPARVGIRDESEDSDEVITSTPKRRRRSNFDQKSQMKFGDSEHDSDDPVTSVRLKTALKVKNKSILSREKEKENDHEPLEPKEADVEEYEKDLEEDLAFLSTKKHVLPSRTRYNGSSPKKTPYQKKLAELRAKRAGKPIEENSDSENSNPKRALYDTDDDEGKDDEMDDPEVGDDSHAESSDESWIVDDDGSATIGAPEIPLEFTRLSHQSTQANFKICCQWVVQSILNPDFPLDDEISQFAIRVLERKIDSYGDSVLQSSIWKAPFMRAMKARPVFETVIRSERPTCDACGKSKRPAPHAVTFSGERYDKTTLENFEGSEAADSEDSLGLGIPDTSTVFYLGRNCHARAQMSHAFIHWKKQLRDGIEGILESQGYFKPHWVNRAAKMSIAERTTWANTVTDNLGNQIKEFYTDLKKGLAAAQKNMTNQRFGKWR